MSPTYSENGSFAEALSQAKEEKKSQEPKAEMTKTEPVAEPEKIISPKDPNKPLTDMEIYDI